MIGFITGIALGLCAGPLAVFLVAYYFSARDRRGIEVLDDRRRLDEKTKDKAARDAALNVGPGPHF